MGCPLWSSSLAIEHAHVRPNTEEQHPWMEIFWPTRPKFCPIGLLLIHEINLMDNTGHRKSWIQRCQYLVNGICPIPSCCFFFFRRNSVFQDVRNTPEHSSVQLISTVRSNDFQAQASRHGNHLSYKRYSPVIKRSHGKSPRNGGLVRKFHL